MKKFNRLFVEIIILFAVIMIGINVYLTSMFRNEDGREYRVEINRLQKEIETNGIESIDIDKYSCVTKITMMKKDMDQKLFLEGDLSDYVIKNINGVYYRFDYQIRLYDEYRAVRLLVNISAIIMVAVVLIVLAYMRAKLVKPFNKIKDVPYELSKGNLTAGLKENKSHFFGRFVWGLDLLREHLEEEKGKELTLQKEKKTLVLSISHDIKTPLSAIKLYSKALIRNLYDSEDKRIEIAEKIDKSADEIEGFVSQIIKASSEDFLKLEVNNTEFYLNELIQKINSYYTEKLALMNTDFIVEKYGNCLIKGDINRAIEVLQNIIENAIKYGDGQYIRIMISREEDCRLITVANSGSTLNKNELPYIFESFWRGSNVGGNSGNGLGLYICRQLMMKMDGDIYAEGVNTEMRVTAVMRMI
ncbi:MAG TPA: HAMP domain-containing sensor histidine kinase [Mobilitalea sp.]|nr:HAMP domain-containing sensor histidine kinase [Mobilitalea sp.]